MSTQPENEAAEIEEIFWLSKLEESWRRSLPKQNDSIWLETFPEAKEIVPTKIKEWQELYDQLLVDTAKELARYRQVTSNIFNYWFCREWLRATKGEELAVANNHIKRLKRMIAKPVQKNGLTLDQIDSARNVPMVEVVDLKLRHVGKTYNGLCPFHNDHHPSFYIYPESNTFVCFACQAKGDVITYAMKTKNLSFSQAVEWLVGGI